MCTSSIALLENGVHESVHSIDPNVLTKAAETRCILLQNRVTHQTVAYKPFARASNESQLRKRASGALEQGMARQVLILLRIDIASCMFSDISVELPGLFQADMLNRPHQLHIGIINT